MLSVLSDEPQVVNKNDACDGSQTIHVLGLWNRFAFNIKLDNRNRII